MKPLLPFLLFTSSLFAQTDCTAFLKIIGQRDISQAVIDMKENCGPFVETVSADGKTKTYTSEEKGIELHFINRAKDKFSLPKYEVLTIELSSFTDRGGYKQEFPFGFTLGMDHKMVKEHIMQLEDVKYEKKDLSKKRSSFTFIGYANTAAQGRKVRVSISQFDGKSITSFRLRLM